MIVKKRWIEYTHGGTAHTFWQGWYLFGFIPLYLRQVSFDRYNER
jgi:hypothetical protein